MASTTPKMIIIKGERLEITGIKRYKAFEADHVTDRYGIYVYFSMSGNNNRIYRSFQTEKERDDIIMKLDEAKGIV